MPEDVVQEYEPTAECASYGSYGLAPAPIPVSAEQQAIWNAEAEKRMAWEREQMASANKRQSRATALQLAVQLAGPLSGDAQAIVRAARDFCAFIEE